MCYAYFDKFLDKSTLINTHLFFVLPGIYVFHLGYEMYAMFEK